MLGAGKKTKEWDKARKVLKVQYLQKGITTCELMFDGCWGNNALSFAHRYKRNDPRCEHSFNGTILACIPCHDKIEHDKALTEKMFGILRNTT
ncbi:MAG: hypothetical protein MOGMAGMI_01837 [Candidatus Omnitrophica bacterium]|nr:hypothetical protein [Candidatus Omnitrophota bacterium]